MGTLLLSPVFLVLLLILLIYIPFIQDWLVGIAAKRLSESTGWDVRVERVRLTPLLDVDVQGVSVVDKNAETQLPDTILALEHLIVDLDMGHVFKGRFDVDGVDLKNAQVNTKDLIATMQLRGRVGQFHLDSHDVDFKHRRLVLSNSSLRNCDIDVALRDTVVEDTTSTPIPWVIDVRQVALENTRFTLHTPGDSLVLSTELNRLALAGGRLDLEHYDYRLDNIGLDARLLHVDNTYEPENEAGIDVNHLRFNDICVGLRDFAYDDNLSALKCWLADLRLKEACGLELSEGRAQVLLDAERVCLDSLLFATPNSRLQGQVHLDWTALTPSNRGHMEAELQAEVGTVDVLLATDRRAEDFAMPLPERLANIDVLLEGNVDTVSVRRFSAEMPERMLLEIGGTACNVLDEEPEVDVRVALEGNDLRLVGQLLQLDGISLPPLTVDGDAHLCGQMLDADLTMLQAGGKARLKGFYDMATDAYRVNVSTDRLQLHNFLPHDSLYLLTAEVEANGRGFDLLSKKTNLQASVNLHQLQYGNSDFSNVHAALQLRGGECDLMLDSNNDLLRVQLSANGCMGGKALEDITFDVHLSEVDLHRLGVTAEPLHLAMNMNLNGHSNFADTHYLKGSINGITLQTRDSVFHPRDLRLEAMLQPDTIHAVLAAGDKETGGLAFALDTKGGIDRLMDQVDRLLDEADRQLKAHDVQLASLNALLPTMRFRLVCGPDNPVANFSRHMLGVPFEMARMELTSSPEDGLRSKGVVREFTYNDKQIDTLQWELAPDSVNMNLMARIYNGPDNPQAAFEALLTASLGASGASAKALYYDEKRRKGIDLGAEAEFSDEGVRLHFTPQRGILAYRSFTFNPDNYLFLHRETNRLEADLQLVTDDNTGIMLYSTPNEEAQQDLTCTVRRLNLGEITALSSYLPVVTGLLEGDVRFVQTEDSRSFQADLMVNNMTFEGTAMGNIGINALYLPNEDGTHYVDGFITQNGNEIAVLNGTYYDGEDATIDAHGQFAGVPLRWADPFLDESMKLQGNLYGELEVGGLAKHPRIEGYVTTEDMHLLLPAYNVDLKFPGDTLAVVDNHLRLQDLCVQGKGKEPLVLNGELNFDNLSDILVDLKATAHNFNLIDSPAKRHSEAYGQLFVDIMANIRGSLSKQLDVTGKLVLLSHSNVSYVMVDTPLTTEDEMADLVEFVSFDHPEQQDTTEVVPDMNLLVQMDLVIQDGAQLHIFLDETGSTYANVVGSGNLILRYDPVKDLQLFGRYSIQSGDMKYNLMIVPLKQFTLSTGSYLYFDGPIDDPYLNVVATEHVSTTIMQDNVPRTVEFDVGLNVSQTLGNMGLSFTIDAPDDIAIRNELGMMTNEQRSQVAVMMLATGMYISENNSGGFSTSNALNAFLQSEISKIAEKALKTMSVSVGVENGTNQMGNTTTDYSFQFSKRFWNNRVSVNVGGLVSTGADARTTGQNIVNNVSLEYCLDKSRTRYVTIYYDRNRPSLLEGEVMEMGAGIVLRRKSDKIGDIFRFRNRKEDEE